MPDIETVARLLADFDRAVKSAGKDEMSGLRTKRTESQVYEACVGRLGDGERYQLAEIIKKMMPEVEWPPRSGAIVP